MVESFEGERITYICVHAPEEEYINRACFRLETEMFGPEDIASIAPSPGVLILNGSPFEGIHLYWNPTDLNHRPVLNVVLNLIPPHQEPDPLYADYRIWIREAALYASVTDSILLQDVGSYVPYIDCFDPHLLWMHPDTVEVTIGTLTAIDVMWVLSTAQYYGSNIEISDDRSWVSNWHPNHVYGDACATCPWHWGRTHISVAVPEDAPANTHSIMTIRPTNDNLEATSMYLRAVSPISTESNTWGQIKNLYKEQ